MAVPLSWPKPSDRLLCVPSFRLVCLFQVKSNIPGSARNLTPVSHRAARTIRHRRRSVKRAFLPFLPCCPHTTLGALLQGQRKFRYWDDFGDDWWHTLTVEMLPRELLPLQGGGWEGDGGEASDLCAASSPPPFPVPPHRRRRWRALSLAGAAVATSARPASNRFNRLPGEIPGLTRVDQATYTRGRSNEFPCAGRPMMRVVMYPGEGRVFSPAFATPSDVRAVVAATSPGTPPKTSPAANS